MPQVTPDSLQVILDSLQEAQIGLQNLCQNKQTLEAIVQAAKLMARTHAARGRLFSCGNGGSMCDAMHFAEELTGRFRSDRPAVAAVAISDPSHLSCVGNDYGYEEVFARYLAAHGRDSDVLLAISTSGSSRNIVRAVEEANKIGMHVVALTGQTQCHVGDLADIHIATPAGRWADRVQELHIKVIHNLIDLIERELFPA